MAQIKHLDRIMRSFEEGYDQYSFGIRDLDFEWFACDRNGCLGVFTTGAQLDASPCVVGDRVGFLALVRHLLDMPPRGQSLPSQPSLWFDYGARGLVGYDVPRPALDTLTYDRRYVPSVRATLDDLPSGVRAAMERVCLDADFFQDHRVQASQLLNAKLKS